LIIPAHSPGSDEGLEQVKAYPQRSGDIKEACAAVEGLLANAALLPKEKSQLNLVLDVLHSAQQSLAESPQRIMQNHASRPTSSRKQLQRKSTKQALIEQIDQAEDIDVTTKEFLHMFAADGQPHKRKTLRQIVQAIMFMSRLRTSTNDTAKKAFVHSTSMEVGDTLKEALDSMGSVQQFDVFHVDVVTEHHPLVPVAMSVVSSHGLQSYISPGKWRAFVAQIEDLYADRPYHNRLHAADVTQMVHVIVASKPRIFSELHLVATLFATVCHDVGHPGVTNSFHVNTADDLAITYNDKSVNENMHCALSYRTQLKDSCQCFEPLSREQYTAVRKLVVDFILGTDMVSHFDNMKQFKHALEEFGTDIATWESPGMVLHWVVHAADISSTARPLHTADRWTGMLTKEFFDQGDRERELGLPISPLCDRHTVSTVNAQIGFVNFIVKPSFEVLAPLCEVQEALDNLNAYLVEYNGRLAKEKAAQEKEKANGEKERAT